MTNYYIGSNKNIVSDIVRWSVSAPGSALFLISPAIALGTLLLTHRPEENWSKQALKEQPKIERVIETKPSAIAIKAGPSMEATVTGYKQKSPTLLQLAAELYLGVFAVTGLAALLATARTDEPFSRVYPISVMGAVLITGVIMTGVAGTSVIVEKNKLPPTVFNYQLNSGKEMRVVQTDTHQPHLKIGEKVKVTPIWTTNGKSKEKVIMDSIYPVEQTTAKKRNAESNTKHPKISYLRTGVSDVVPTTVPTAVSVALRQMRTENTLYNLATNKKSLSRTVS